MAQRTWSSTVVEHHRLREDLAVVRLVGDVVPFRPGQYVDVALESLHRAGQEVDAGPAGAQEIADHRL